MNKNESSKDSMVKSLGTILLSIIVVALVYSMFFSPQQNYGGFGSNMHMGNYEMQMGTGMGTGFNFNLGYILGGILLILIKLLSIILVVGVVVGLWVLVKDYLFAEGENPFAALTKTFTQNKMNCPKCGSSVETRWDFCPDCGEPLTKQEKLVQNDNQNPAESQPQQ